MADEEEAYVRSGRGKWSVPGVPHRGWQCVAHYDALEDADELEVCEMCESTPIRFVHVMEHDLWPDKLHCGCVCAGHMAEDLTGAQERERAMRGRASRRAKFPDRRGWKLSARGTPHIKVDGYHIMIARRGGGYGVGITAPGEHSPTWGSRSYNTLREAQMGCFDALEHKRGRRT